jgi:hypothetical protein
LIAGSTGIRSRAGPAPMRLGFFLNPLCSLSRASPPRLLCPATQSLPAGSRFIEACKASQFPSRRNSSGLSSPTSHAPLFCPEPARRGSRLTRTNPRSPRITFESPVFRPESIPEPALQGITSSMKAGPHLDGVSENRARTSSKQAKAQSVSGLFSFMPDEVRLLMAP